MKKQVFGRKLSRTRNQRVALFRGLLSALVERGEIETTLAKGKAIRGQAEKLITKAKKGTLTDKRVIFRTLSKKFLVDRLVEEIGPVFKERKGGYLRLIKTGQRKGDGAKMVKIILTEKPLVKTEIKNDKTD